MLAMFHPFELSPCFVYTQSEAQPDGSHGTEMGHRGVVTALVVSCEGGLTGRGSVPRIEVHSWRVPEPPVAGWVEDGTGCRRDIRVVVYSAGGGTRSRERRVLIADEFVNTDPDAEAV